MPSTSADKRQVPALKSLTLEEWVAALRDPLGPPPCPRCGADGDAWPVDQANAEILGFEGDCGSYAEVANDSNYMARAYNQLMASCPVFVPPGPRRRIWENAQ